MMLIDKMLLTNDCKLSCISSETLKYDMRKSMCRATPGDSTVHTVVRSVKAGNRKSGGITQCFFLVKSCQLEVRGFDIKIDF